MQVRKQQLELDMEQQTGSKQEKEYVKAVYCHPAYLTYNIRIICYNQVQFNVEIKEHMFIFTHLKYFPSDFPGSPMVKNPPAIAGDTGLIPGLGRFYVLQGN